MKNKVLMLMTVGVLSGAMHLSAPVSEAVFSQSVAQEINWSLPKADLSGTVAFAETEGKTSDSVADAVKKALQAKALNPVKATPTPQPTKAPEAPKPTKAPEATPTKAPSSVNSNVLANIVNAVKNKQNATPTPTPTPAPVVMGNGEGYKYITGTVNVRSKASSSSEKLGKLAEGEAVKILGTSGNWYRIAYKGGEAYVSKNYVTDTCEYEEIFSKLVVGAPVYSFYEPLNEEVQKVLDKVIDENMTTYQRVKACYDYLIDTCEKTGQDNSGDGIWPMGSEEDYAYKGWGILAEHIGGCSDYSAAFSALLKAQGIDCKIVDGETTLSSGGYTYHVWNEIEIDGKIYTFDAQVEDNIVKKNGYNLNLRFCKEYSDKDVWGKFIKNVNEYDKNGNLVAYGTFGYDKNGKKFEELSYKADYVYDDQNRVLNVTEYNSAGKVTGSREYAYDEWGNKVLEVEYDKDGNVGYYYQYAFNEQGNYTLYKVKTPWYFSHYEKAYNESGRCTKKVVYNESGNVTQKYGYDDWGWQCGYEEYDVNGNLTYAWGYIPE